MGNDILLSRAGDDILIGGSGGDTVNGGGGNDTASYIGAKARVVADLSAPAGNTGDAAGDSYISVENFIGTGFNDNLRGDGAANRIAGGADNDILIGRAGDDTLIGGSGNDTINGGGGVDVLFGHAGADDFVYNSVGDSGLGTSSDRLMDFVVGEDQLDLTAFAIDPSNLSLGGAFTGIAPSARTVETGANTIVFIDADGDLTADMRIVVVGALGLTGTEFIL